MDGKPDTPAGGPDDGPAGQSADDPREPGAGDSRRPAAPPPAGERPGRKPARKPGLKANVRERLKPGGGLPDRPGAESVRALGSRAARAGALLVRPLAERARMQTRHRGLVGSFLALVMVPLFLVMLYLGLLSVDQYSSTAGFTVRQENAASGPDIVGGLAQFAGGSGIATDSGILYAFIQSQEMVTAVNRQVDLREHYTQNWPRDFAFALWPRSTLEDLIWYWRRVVRLAYDSSSGLTEVQVLAYDPDTAQKIASIIVDESEKRINELSEQAREDTLRHARADVEEALERLRGAREAMTGFRSRTQIVDPEADIQGRMGVMNNLQQQLAEALINYDLLQGTTREDDPRMVTARKRIDVIRQRIRIERQTFASDNTDTGGVGKDYPSLISEYESLNLDREFAEQIYRASLMALESARDEAIRNSRYLAVYIKPTLAGSSQYPRRWLIFLLTGVFLLLVWSVGALIYYSIRDRS